MPRHIEQPGSRQSKPASMKMRSSPSASAWRFTSPEPGTTSACLTPGATLRPLATAAATRRSSMRLLVQLPMKMFSTTRSCIRVPAVSPIYSRLLAAAIRLPSSAKLSGAGTTSPMATTSSGLVPQVTSGAMLLPSMITTLS